MKYTPEDMAQNVKKDLREREKVSPENSSPEKTGAAKRLRFFNHCLGRAVRNI
jgi:hypothetical protein